MGWLDTFQHLVDEQVSEKGPVKTSAKLKASDKSVMDKPILRASSEEIEKQKAEEQALIGPTIFGISIDPTDYLTPGGLAKIGAGIGKGMLVGAMKPVAFLAKNPGFANTLVVDAQGLPKEVYRGLSADNTKKAHNAGIWFGDTQTANLYAKGKDARIEPSMLDIKRPTNDLLEWNNSVKAGDNRFDGYIGVWGEDQTVFAVKDPKQIKSSITGD